MPVTSDECKAWLVDVLAEENAMIDSLISSSVGIWEHETREILAKSEGLIYATDLSRILIEHRPVWGITKIEVHLKDAEGYSDLSLDHYRLSHSGGMLSLINFMGVDGIALADVVSPVKVTLDLGYDLASADPYRRVSEKHKLMIKQLAAIHYEYRNSPPASMLKALEMYMFRHSPLTA